MPRTRPYSATTRSIMAVAILLLAPCGTRLARGPPLHPQPRNSLVSSPGVQVGLDGESLSGRKQAGEFERKPSFLSKGDRGFVSPSSSGESGANRDAVASRHCPRAAALPEACFRPVSCWTLASQAEMPRAANLRPLTGDSARQPQGGAARGLAEAVEGATWRWRNSARQSVRCLAPKTRARGSARRQARHKARVEPLARRLGQSAAIAQQVGRGSRGPVGSASRRRRSVLRRYHPGL
jgi:hypothetical protein